MEQRNIVLAFDTANEVIAIGVGELDEASRTVRPLAHEEVAAHRASNAQLVPRIDALLAREGIARGRIACVACGRGPGSFTGVRICMATAKGIASALDVPLWGVSSLDAIAWQLQAAGVRGAAAVAADAMRKEVYPVRYELSDEGVARQNEDCVLKAADAAAYLAKGLAGAAGVDAAGVADRAGAADDANVAGATSVDFPSAPNTAATIAGDALRKYADLFEPLGSFAEEGLWTPTGEGLLLAFQAAWRTAGFDALDAQAGNPAFALPVYTRLSDAEENERIRLAKNDPKNLTTGVQESEAGLRADQRRTMHDAAILNAQPDEHGVVYKPLDAAHAAAVAALEARAMGTDAWNEALVLDELPRRDRVWWAAYVDDALAGYVGTWVVDGQMQVLKIAVEPAFRRRGIARELLARAAADARDLGASEATLEVRASNEGAQALYTALGFQPLGVRPRYYSDREDAVIMSGPLPLAARDVAGMRLQEQAIARDQDAREEERGVGSLESVARRPLILAIESSCDETAAAIIDGAGTLLSDVVASQIDFHARFGGVVPEIASRKHIEAICGVTQEALDVAARRLDVPRLRWRDLDAVAVTYAPGLVGALVVGVAFAKGAAWGAEVPFIGVNHMEGHLYANKIATPDIEPPMVVSLVSGGHTMLVLVKAWGDYETLGADHRRRGGGGVRQGGEGARPGVPGRPGHLEARRAGRPEGHRLPARAAALARPALLALRPENRRDHLPQQRARRRPRAQPAGHRCQLPGTRSWTCRWRRRRRPCSRRVRRSFAWVAAWRPIRRCARPTSVCAKRSACASPCRRCPRAATTPA